MYVSSVAITVTSQKILKRLVQYCKTVHSIVPQPHTNKGAIGMVPCVPDKHFTLFVGEQSSQTNLSGLSLIVSGNKNYAFLCADHSYSQVFGDMLSTLTHSTRVKRINILNQDSQLHLVVPHHGGCTCSFPSVFLPIQSGRAMVSTGSNPYGHPKKEARQYLQSLNFQWSRTDWQHDDICVTL